MKNRGFREKLLVLIIPFLFLVVGIITLKDYGVNWDEPYHFQRGQAYLYYFLTGKKNYLDMPAYPLLRGSSDFVSKTGEQDIAANAIKSLYDPNSKIKRSYFQSDVYPFEYFVEKDEGHPPSSDILAAFFNYILYQKLGVMGDLESHHFYGIFLSSILTLGVVLFLNHKYGIFPAIVSAVSLGAYPLFFSESHFNIKDPPETAYFGLTIITFYFGIVKKNWKILIPSSIFGGFALGTKFNIIFASLIVIPWLFFYMIKNNWGVAIKKILKKALSLKALILSLFIYLPVVFAIVYLTWPFLWDDPFSRFLKIIGFYKQIGIGTPSEMKRFIIQGWNTYPIVWIALTTQIPILLLSGIGFVYSFFAFIKKRDDFSLFAMLWILIPLFRVSFPNAGIYGGVRQVMEFVPALAVLAGIGAFCLAKAKLKRLAHLVIFLSLAFAIYEMVKIHPNQNVYFNQLIGGLRGAKEKNIPYWGNTYGNVYLQGVEWLNEHVEPNAKLGLPIANMINVPRLRLRSDIDFTNAHWSGPMREGEYEMEIDFEWPPKYWYSFQYYDKYLEPVYVVSVQGVPLLKIWKNDLEHTKPEFKEEIIFSPEKISFRKNKLNTELYIDLGRDIYITRITINHQKSGCKGQAAPGYIALSLDNKIWEQEPDPINTPQVPVTATGWDEDTFVFLFAGKKARYVVIDPQMENSCYLKDPRIEIKGLKKLPSRGS